AVITFALDGTWMKSYGLTPADIVMLRNHDGAWTELPTKFDHLDGNTYYFTATTPGFSYFAVASRVGSAATATATPTTKATSVPAAAVTTAVPVHTVTAKVTTAQTTSVPVAAMQTSAGAAPSSVLPKGLNSKSAMIGGIAGIVIVITGIVLYRRKKRQSLDPLRPRR
ncbi:MAG: PGF-pre-PGF domain-containing protein, partial [Methanoregulaceae archaeon]